MMMMRLMVMMMLICWWFMRLNWNDGLQIVGASAESERERDRERERATIGLGMPVKRSFCFWECHDVNCFQMWVLSTISFLFGNRKDVEELEQVYKGVIISRNYPNSCAMSCTCQTRKDLQVSLTPCLTHWAWHVFVHNKLWCNFHEHFGKADRNLLATFTCQHRHNHSHSHSSCIQFSNSRLLIKTKASTYLLRAQHSSCCRRKTN